MCALHRPRGRSSSYGRRADPGGSGRSPIGQGGEVAPPVTRLQPLACKKTQFQWQQHILSGRIGLDLFSQHTQEVSAQMGSFFLGMCGQSWSQHFLSPNYVRRKASFFLPRFLFTYCGWTTSCTTLNAFETIFHQYLQVNPPSRVSQVVQDVVHPQYVQQQYWKWAIGGLWKTVILLNRHRPT